MNAKTWTKKIAGAAVVGSLLAGVGMSAALAATPAKTASPVGGYATSQVTNLTPYTWTLLPEPGWSGPYDVAPPQTVAPGQTALWVADDICAEHWEALNYSFQDFTGGWHDVMVEDESNGYDAAHQYVESWSRDGYGWDAPVSTANFRMAMDPDGSARHVDAIWTQPSAMTIDANTDPNAAQSIVNSELPRVTANDVKWTPNSSTPTFEHVNSQQISSTLENYSSAPATLLVSHDTSVGQSTTIGVETSASLSTNVFGFVAKATASVTGETQWGTSDSVTIDQHTEIAANSSGYLYSDTSIATVTGTLTITTPEGAIFTIKNVSISRGDIIDPNHTKQGGMEISATQSTAPPLTSASAPIAGGRSPKH